MSTWSKYVCVIGKVYQTDIDSIFAMKMRIQIWKSDKGVSPFDLKINIHGREQMIGKYLKFFFLILCSATLPTFVLYILNLFFFVTSKRATNKMDPNWRWAINSQMWWHIYISTCVNKVMKWRFYVIQKCCHHVISKHASTYYLHTMFIVYVYPNGPAFVKKTHFFCLRLFEQVFAA